MRQQLDKSEIKKNFVIDEEVINTLGKFLDSPSGLHIDNVYFTSEGYYYNVHAYKKEQYSRVDIEETFDAETRLYKLKKIYKDERKVIKTMLASDIVSQYLKLKKNNK